MSEIDCKKELKQALLQYCDIKQEIEDKKKRIADLEKQISKIEEEGTVIDKVTGGFGGIQSFKIEGFPEPEYYKKLRYLRISKKQYEDITLKLLEQANIVEQYINSIDDSRIRRIITYKYADGLTWIQVAHKMGRPHTEESCRKSIERYFNV